MKKRRKVEKDQRMIRSAVFERCGHSQKRKREKVCFSLMPGIGRFLCVCIRYPLPKCQLGMSLKWVQGTKIRNGLSQEEDRVGRERERESTSVTFLRCACVRTLLARMRTCCQRRTDSQIILAAASSSRRIM